MASRALSKVRRAWSMRSLLADGWRGGKQGQMAEGSFFLEIAADGVRKQHSWLGDTQSSAHVRLIAPLHLRWMQSRSFSAVAETVSISKDVSEPGPDDHVPSVGLDGAEPGQQQAAQAQVDKAAGDELGDVQKLVAGLGVKELNKLMTETVSRSDHLRAQLIFDAWSSVGGNEPSVLTYNLLLHAMVRSGTRLDTLQAVLGSMEARGLQPNTLSFNSLLRAAFRERDSAKAEQILKRMEGSGGLAAPDADSYNLVVSLCALDRRVGGALLHAQSMLRGGFVPSKSTYNEVLLACARMRRSRDAIAVLRELQAQSIIPLPATLGELLSASAEAEDPECCQLVLEITAQRKLDVDEGALLLALNLAARASSPALAEQAWALLTASLQDHDALPPFHLARIHTYASAGDFLSAFRAVRELEEAWGQEDPHLLDPLAALRPLTQALSRGVGVLDTAYYALAEVHAAGEAVALSSLNCVVAGCSSVRDMDRARQTFDEISATFELPPSIHSYNALLDGYAKTRQASRAEQYFLELQQRGGLEPTERTYTLLATAFITSMDAARAVESVEAMVGAGFTPPRDLLLHLYRRSSRSGFQNGADVAVTFLTRFGYRHSHVREGRRRSNLLEVVGFSQDPRPVKRERTAGAASQQRGPPRRLVGGQQQQPPPQQRQMALR